GRVGLRVEVDHRLPALQAGQCHLVVVLVQQRERGGLVTWLEHHTTTIGAARPYRAGATEQLCYLGRSVVYIRRDGEGHSPDGIDIRIDIAGRGPRPPCRPPARRRPQRPGVGHAHPCRLRPRRRRLGGRVRQHPHRHPPPTRWTGWRPVLVRLRPVVVER